MLLLTRKRSEVIQIGNDIVIKVVQTGRRIVKIGIEAPKDVRVLRGELAPQVEALEGAEAVVEPLPKPAKNVPAPLSYFRKTKPRHTSQPMPAEAAVYLPPALLA